MLALIEAGIEVSQYAAFEIDRYAIKTSLHNFPSIDHGGDVFTADFSEYKGCDLLIGGSPCTFWSICQKQNRETEASGMGWDLFSQYVRAIKEAQPKYFIYENNKSMPTSVRGSITNSFGFEPIYINSSLVSAQHRQRLYWVGRRKEDGTYEKVEIDLPDCRHIALQDVIDSAGMHKADHESHNQQPEEPVRIGTWPNKAKNQGHDSQQYRIYSIVGKSVTLCGNGGGMGAKTGLYAIPINISFGNQISEIHETDGKIYPVFEVKSGLTSINGNECLIKLSDGFYIIRKLTIAECKRLQTVPEWYEFPVSDTQAYKMLGNGWTVSVIAYILNNTELRKKTGKRN